jgi:hypothetical protein
VQDADDARGADTGPATDTAPATDTGPAPDLEYDLAHEAIPGTVSTAGPVPAQEQHLILVATQTQDYDGDYSYDLAHDVPGR